MASVNVLVHIFPVFSLWANVCTALKKKPLENRIILYVQCLEQYLAQSEMVTAIIIVSLL